MAALAQATTESGLPIVAAYLFGSTAREESGPLSDVDVAVLFDETIGPEAQLGAAAQLHSSLERISPQPVQIVILNDASPLLKHHVLRDGLVLVGQQAPKRVAFEASALCEYLDIAPMIERYDRALIARAKAGRIGA